ncbi:MAG: Gfo/Idh/MocA family oxidoreductase [Treponema sp.]|nr:Gfo/Idh/MocA family oxidoreductase [Treponema sp.]
MTNKYTAAIVGTGRIGFTLGFDKKREQPASHTMSLLGNKKIEIVAGCDTNTENLERFINYVSKYNPKVQAFTSLDELLTKKLPDIIVIAVNEESHLETAIKVIEKQPKIVILEKPVALNVAQGEKIKAALEKSSSAVIVNHERRFADDYNFAKKYMEKIGKILTVNARLDSGLRVYTPECENNGEYSLLHDGTHLVDAVLFLLNQDALENVQLICKTMDENDTQVVRTATVHAQSTVCPDINLYFSGASRYFGFEVEIIGSLGRIKIGNGIHQFYQRKESKLYTGFFSLEADKKEPSFKKTGYFSNMTQNAVDFLDGNCELKSTLETGLNTLAILEEIKNQLKQN